MQRLKVGNIHIFDTNAPPDRCVVDENMFYKGVDKKAVHNARLQQVHSLEEPSLDRPLISEPPTHPNMPVSHSKEQEEERPPYPFDTGASLLALTHKHNVCNLMLMVSLYLISYVR